MSYAQFKLIEATALAILPPLVFSAFHLAIGERPLVTEFEAGGIFGVVSIKLMEALYASIFGKFKP